ncbi:hypothetical protein ASPWEDRAFT_104551, partial [Aspergillus wentii DTO 134E9]
QVDQFRKFPGRPLPLAYFLSHVHSDHLQGLESFRAPFIYCSAATRELLLRIEKYPHRMNFSKGILESRRLHYKHLAKLLRPIPLNTPTDIELTPRLSIRVTLFDANHCAGAVMFLIEGNGKAILYTGDIRSESWWVNSLVRHPILLPYTLGNKRLDKIYLDTTFARASKIYHAFPPKAEGLSELLQKVEQYPSDTIFYFRAWTFGYEEVWMALAAALNTKVHADRYQMGLYRSLVTHVKNGNNFNEAPALCGFELGNKFVPGCLSDDESSRIHSCEPGLPCSVVKSKKTVEILPIVSRTQDGLEMPEVGAGGGGGDLYQMHELLLPDQFSLEELEKLCLERIHDAKVLSQTREALLEAFKSKNKSLSLDSYGLKDEHDMPLEKLVAILSRGHSGNNPLSNDIEELPTARANPNKPLPNTIHFPYSRHSSYMELCELVSAFQPKDIYPCTVDLQTWDEDVSMQSLFGHLCSGDEFSHDARMRETLGNDEYSRSRKRACLDDAISSQSTQYSSSLRDSSLTGIWFNLDQSSQGVNADQRALAPNPTSPSKETPLSSSSSRIHLPSSLETIKSTIQQTEPLHIPPSMPATQKFKRNEIRQAREFLKAANLGIQIGPLPSSWPTEEEDEFNIKKPEPATGKKDEHEHEDVDIDDAINDNNDDDTHTIHPDSQLTNPLSIPDSAFASDEEQVIEIDSPSTNKTISPGSSTGDNDTMHKSTLTKSSSSRRRAAYLAARADSFEAWSSVSLVSAGNNHTEEEIEL